MSGMLDHALALASHGLRVFPVWDVLPPEHEGAPARCGCGHPHDDTPAYEGGPPQTPANIGKHPAGGSGHLDATSDPETIRAWWTAMPDVSVAVACESSGLLVVDIDPRNGGLESFAVLESRIEMPRTMSVKSGGGGFHLYYRHPGGRFPPNLKKHGYPGIDLKTKGYVVAPPSTHASGTRYEWLIAPWDAGAADPPPEFVEMARSRVQGDAERTPYEGGQPADEGLLEHAWQAALAHGPSISGQGGDNHAYQLGTILLCDYDLEWEDAWEIASRWNEHFVENHWSDDKLATKLRNGASYASGKRGSARRAFETDRYVRRGLAERGLRPFAWLTGDYDDATGAAATATGERSGPDPADSAVDTPDAVAPVAPSLALDDGVPFIEHVRRAYHDLVRYRGSGDGEAADERLHEPMFEPAVNLFRREFPATNWLVRGLITGGSVNMYSGEPKSAKSWCAWEVALAVATNTKAFGEFQTGPAKTVALFTAEDPGRSLRNRLRGLAAFRNIDPEDAVRNLHVKYQTPINLMDDGQLSWLIASCRVLPRRPSLLVLDPMRDLHNVDEDSSTEMSEFMSRLRAARDLATDDGSIILVHHSAKLTGDVAKRRGGQKARGSSAIHGAVDGGFYLWNLDTDGRTHWSVDVEVEQRYAQGAGVFKLALHLTDDENGEVTKAEWKKLEIRAADSDKVANDKNLTTVVRAMAGIGGGGTQTEIREECGISFRRLTPLLNELEKTGKIEKRMQGKAHVGWDLVPAVLAQAKAEGL